MRTRVVVAAAIIVVLLSPTARAEQSQADVWRTFAGKVDTGTDLDVRLLNGQRFRASLVEVRPDAVLLQPRTRVRVPVQAVSYSLIASLERHPQGGMSPGKAAALGAATGVGAFLAMLAILFVAIDD